MHSFFTPRKIAAVIVALASVGAPIAVSEAPGVAAAGVPTRIPVLGQKNMDVAVFNVLAEITIRVEGSEVRGVWDDGLTTWQVEGVCSVHLLGQTTSAGVASRGNADVEAPPIIVSFTFENIDLLGRELGAAGGGKGDAGSSCANPIAGGPGTLRVQGLLTESSAGDRITHGFMWIEPGLALP